MIRRSSRCTARRLGTVEEIADAVLDLAGADFTNGIVLPVDGGATAGNS
jgi:NAD(P)-dependent dehydrogenase (short-subunit alcohol dehydrogenase family)